MQLTPLTSVAKLTAQTTTVLTVKANGGVLHAVSIYNPNATVSYVQFFDLNTTVTLATTVPNFVLPIPAGAASNLSNLNIGFTNGLKLAATTTSTGNTAPSTGLDGICVYS